jgi:SAM-dependent methyltransferase
MLGATVHSVDVNPDFIKLIRLRQERHKLPITSEVSTFEAFDTTETYDAIIFYECLHHSAKPWELISRAYRWLKPGGKILFAGEPVNDQWLNWGLRLDAQSVYCIRKFGWFESGWSKAFISQCFWRGGFAAQIDFFPNRDVGYVCIAKRLDPSITISAKEMRSFVTENSQEWHESGKYLVSTGDSTFDFVRPFFAREVYFEVSNFRGALVPVEIFVSGRSVFASILAPGTWTIKCPLESEDVRLRFVSEPWVPAIELGSPDTRSVSLFFSGARFV